MSTIPCLRCGNQYSQGKRGRRSHYCQDCRPLINNERKLARYHEMETLKADIRTSADSWIISGGLDDRADSPVYVQMEDYLESLEFNEVPITRDRMPDGWHSASGPDEGYTTEYEDVAVLLETNRRAAMRHPWWSENPHWNVGL